ncbi:uncharacterized protein MAM_01144 [Metarhizium album ARSEF 1941]|uniref:Uncharacterized protein n=1 Tax=Metarhizium album (strain ARSEF 1941) TaxID=1081103 RepID=A0A0B2X4Z4_METAS|nr:uncharacterized protein MAM_01144 [Metarhizium album ARSEF 1941]KHO00366.1 hypothetical protein MAM_01144 [Metarhizium album ARSEF 1941]
MSTETLVSVLEQNTKVEVENLPLGSPHGDLHESLLDPNFTRHLVSLKVARPTPPLTAKVDSLKRLLVQCPSLERLHYEDVGHGTSFALSTGERLPAFSSLVLKSYDWSPSAEEVQRHWSLSETKSLVLVSVPLFNFLESISPRDLSNLARLQVNDNWAHASEAREEATRGLCLLVRHHIKALEVLDIICHTKLFHVECILQHGGSLGRVHFRDYVGLSHDDGECPTLRPEEVTRLGQGLPFVHTLELDTDEALRCPPESLRGVASFPMLRTLMLHVRTLLRTTDKDGATRDRDYESAHADVLLPRAAEGEKQAGSAVEEHYRKCRRMATGHVMLRRMGSEWRRKNAQGMFAERLLRAGERRNRPLQGSRRRNATTIGDASRRRNIDATCGVHTCIGGKLYLGITSRHGYTRTASKDLGSFQHPVPA